MKIPICGDETLAGVTRHYVCVFVCVCFGVCEMFFWENEEIKRVIIWRMCGENHSDHEVDKR